LDHGSRVLPADAEEKMATYGDFMDRARDSILYIETDIPPQMTCSDWRRTKAQCARRRFISRLRGRRAAASAEPRTS
jgi:hypothetical protein